MRQISEVILELESKVDLLLTLMRSLDLNTKINSNKLSALSDEINSIKDSIKETPKNTSIASKISVSGKTPDFELLPDTMVTMETEPKGFRRGSRPETYAEEETYLNKSLGAPVARFTSTAPKTAQAEIVVPLQASQKTVTEETKISLPTQARNDVQVMQRVVDKNNKSIFLADIEIIDKTTMTNLPKTRTNAAGKWSASLPIGDYKIFVRRRDPQTREKMEIIQDINVDGTQSPVELPIAKLI